jgi:hypothetical protein
MDRERLVNMTDRRFWDASEDSTFVDRSFIRATIISPLVLGALGLVGWLAAKTDLLSEPIQDVVGVAGVVLSAIIIYGMLPYATFLMIARSRITRIASASEFRRLVRIAAFAIPAIFLCEFALWDAIQRGGLPDVSLVIVYTILAAAVTFAYATIVDLAYLLWRFLRDRSYTRPAE